MNHLAHFVLSENDEDIAIGNFIADFISNKEVKFYAPNIQLGIKLHREIDAFTDTHVVVKQSTQRLHPYHHKYAPVIVDVYYDFLLARFWDKVLPSVSVRDFTSEIYTLLKNRKDELPETLKKRLPYMIADDWLMKYTTLEGLEEAFKRIEKAAAFPGNFGNAVNNLKIHLTDFESEFQSFFPDLKTHAQQVLRNLKNSEVK
jgi:acyl carrier protein phosphodiesterase